MKRMLAVAWVAGLAIFPACDWNDPDEVQNSANEAVIRAQFFASRTSRVPVSGVRFIVETPAEESEASYRGPDVVGISGEDGVVVVRIFPGFDQEAGGGVTPTNPLDLPPPVIFADVGVVIVYQGQFIQFISTGLTVGSGRLYDLGAIFLEDFGLTVN